MNTRPRSSTAERFGRWLGRGWRGYVRRERRAVAWLASVGVPSGAATALVWIVKLAVLGVLLYAAFWLALLLVFVTAAAWASAANSRTKTPGLSPIWTSFATRRGTTRTSTTTTPTSITRTIEVRLYLSFPPDMAPAPLPPACAPPFVPSVIP